MALAKLKDRSFIKVKTSKLISATLLLIAFLAATLCFSILLGCSKGEGTMTPDPDPINKPQPDPEPEPENNPPAAFDLIGVTDGAVGVDVKPSFSWKESIDPDGDTVSYDLFLDTEADPATVFATDLNMASYEVTERLQLLTDFHWKVVAKDGKGGEAQSDVYDFTTRGLNIPQIPATIQANFPIRGGHSTAVFDNKLWVFGGRSDEDDIDSKNDVWYSSDGVNWTEAVSGEPMMGTDQHTTVVFDNKLWVIGGSGVNGNTNDVWYSSDGEAWIKTTPSVPFSGRRLHSTAVFDNKLWVIGGIIGVYANDIWSSSDGLTWTEAAPAAPFSARGGHSTVVFDGKLWVIGGFVAGGSGSTNNVWNSSDGLTWSEVDLMVPFPARGGHSTIVFDNRLWVIGGFGNSDYKSDVWYSSDGATWTEATAVAPFAARYGHTTAVFDSRLWLIGGFNGSIYKNDVWAMD